MVVLPLALFTAGLLWVLALKEEWKVRANLERARADYGRIVKLRDSDERFRQIDFSLDESEPSTLIYGATQAPGAGAEFRRRLEALRPLPAFIRQVTVHNFEGIDLDQYFLPPEPEPKSSNPNDLPIE